MIQITIGSSVSLLMASFQNIWRKQSLRNQDFWEPVALCISRHLSDKEYFLLLNKSLSYEKPRQGIKKQRYHFANKGPYSQSQVQMWELDHKESWATKSGCFQIVVLEKTLESPLYSKEIKPSVIKEINPEYSLKWLMLKLKLQYFGHLMWRADSLEKTLMLGKIEGRQRRGQQRMRRLDGIIGWHYSMDMNLSKLREIVKDSEAWCDVVHGITKS